MSNLDPILESLQTQVRDLTVALRRSNEELVKAVRERDLLHGELVVIGRRAQTAVHQHGPGDGCVPDLDPDIRFWPADDPRVIVFDAPISEATVERARLYVKARRERFAR